MTGAVPARHRATWLVLTASCGCSRFHRSISRASRASSAKLVALGTDGFGRSDTRTALRAYFEVDRHSVVVAALDALAREGTIARSVVADAIARYRITIEDRPPWTH